MKSEQIQTNCVKSRVHRHVDVYMNTQHTSGFQRIVNRKSRIRAKPYYNIVYSFVLEFQVYNVHSRFVLFTLTK